MLLPLVIGQPLPSEELSPDLTKMAIHSAEEAISIYSGTALGVSQALKGLFPRVPASHRPRWFAAFQLACLKQVCSVSQAFPLTGHLVCSGWRPNPSWQCLPRYSSRSPCL